MKHLTIVKLRVEPDVMPVLPGMRDVSVPDGMPPASVQSRFVRVVMKVPPPNCMISYAFSAT